MSKAVTNEEVEDVLSSIRRLVSEDKRPLAGLRSTPVEELAAEENPVDDVPKVSDAVEDDMPEANRLVLTPALRVLPSEPEPEYELEAEVEDDEAEDGPLDLGSVARETWKNETDDVDGSVEEIVDGADPGPMVLFPAAPEQRKDAAMDALDALVHDALENEAKAIEDELDEADYGDEAFWDDDEVAVELDHEQGAAEASDQNDEANWDLQEDVIAELSEDNYESYDRSGNIDAPEAALDDPSVSDEDAAPKVEKLSAGAPLTAKIAALEAALRGTHQEWEPDGDEADTLPLTDAPAMAWEDDVELDAKGAPFVAEPELIQEVEPEIEPEAAPAAAAFATDDQVMDEDALRDLVSEIVRAELQGALGERITRNVRKLVRREIHRALTAQEME
ncbi:hypothetical protein [uncultured Sulfitobacter sp.]|uniref:hypothetical protein n=1 Tax=uncultured Sulfitobacter sp. TaxID=191468 RepID=UPI00260EF877|nr:hypothetical protein [uncultured Sulfitobacter sp.]